MKQDEKQMLYEFSLLWCANPYMNEGTTKRHNVALKLHNVFGGDLSQLLAKFIEELFAIAQHGEADDNVDEEDARYCAIHAYLAYGHYRHAMNKGQAIQINKKTDKWLRREGWNLEGVIAAANRCHCYLAPNSEQRLIFGASREITMLRASIWSACFGASLYQAVRYHDILRKENVLIVGETGTGKESIAKIISEAAFEDTGEKQPGFRVVNAAAIPETLIEGELFGHIKGAFTGANVEKIGMIEQANKGTFFFDEIGDLPLQLQPKILRVLEEGSVRKIGEETERKIDIRFVGATHKSLDEMVSEKSFRQDLLQRFRGYVVYTVPLRELTDEDILEVGTRFAPKEDLVDYKIKFRDHLESKVIDRSWPGNMRELGNVIRSFMLRGPVSAPPGSNFPTIQETNKSLPGGLENFSWTLNELERWYVGIVLEKCGNNKTRAAKVLDISYNQFFRKYKDS